MNREQILAMEPGRELDALVAEKVMGWERNGSRWIDEHGESRNTEPSVVFYNMFNPSTDISAAWEVVEKMRTIHVYELADFGRNKYKNSPHFAAFHPLDKPRDYERQVRAKTLPEAICKASLLAVLEA